MDMLDIMAAKQLAKTIQKGDKGDQGLKGDPGNGDLLAPDFSTSTAYKAGDYVIYDGKLYKFTAAHAAGAWDASQAEIVTLAENLSEQSDDVSELKSTIEQKLDTDLVYSAVGRGITLTNELSNIPTFVKRWGNPTIEIADGVVKMTNDGTDTSPSIIASSWDKGSGTWILRFKWKATKNEATGNPIGKSVYVSSGTTGRVTQDVNYGEWDTVNTLFSGNFSRLIFCLREYSTASAGTGATLEIKEMMLYDAGSLSADQIAAVMQDIETNYYENSHTFQTDVVLSSSFLELVENQLGKPVLFGQQQTLTDAQKLQARENIGAGAEGDIPVGVVLYTEQSLTDSEKAQVRENVNALGKSAVYNPSNTITLTNEISLDSDTFESKWSSCSLAFSDGVMTLTDNGTDKHPTAGTKGTWSKSEGVWLIRFKWRAIQNTAEGTPRYKSVYPGSATGNRIDKDVNYGQWDTFNESMSRTLNRINFGLYGFADASDGTGAALEVKELMIYDVSELTESEISVVKAAIDDNYYATSHTFTMPSELSDDFANAITEKIGKPVAYDSAQTLTDVQKTQARENIEAVSENDVVQLVTKSAEYYQKGASAKKYQTTKKLAIISAGQSNMNGTIPSSDLPNYISLPLSRSHICKSSDGVFSELGTNYYYNTDRWAFDLVTYYYITEVDNIELYVMKKSEGGTSIDPTGASSHHWTADYEQLSSSGASLLRSFENVIRACVDAAGNDFEIRAMLWHQGEGDRASASPTAAKNYYVNFKNMIAYCRGIVGNIRLPFICGTVSHNSIEYDATVDAAIRRVAREDPYVYLVDMSNAQLRDYYHFNAAWAEYFGKCVHDLLIDAGVINATKLNPTEPT